MKRILVPTDFSKHSEFALKVAAQIARDTNSEIFIVHMLELPTQMTDAVSSGADVPEIMLFMNKAHERLEEFTELDYLDGLKVSEAVKLERAFEGILKSTQKYDIDLVVMGSHGASGSTDLIVGSTTERIVRASNAPVLVVKQDNLNFKADKFVFASDFSNEIKPAFQKVINFANLFGSHLELVMINTPNSFKTTYHANSLMKEFVSHFNIKSYSLHTYNDANIEIGIINFSNYIKADIIGMCTHGRTSLYHFFNGSNSEGLLNSATKPVVTFKI